MTPNRSILAAVAMAALSACGAQGTLMEEPQVARFTQEIPPGADPGACWGKHVTPAVIETVTRQVLVQPAEVRADGSVTSPAVYRTETVQDIVEPREERWFETPCEDVMTEEFVASLQRALSIRGYYVWPVNGQLDSRTRAAVRRYQKSEGLDTGILTLATAQQLGLVAERTDGRGHAPGQPTLTLQTGAEKTE